MKIRLLTLIALALLNFACSVNKLITEANESFDRQEYFAAAEKIKIVGQKVKDKSQKSNLNFKLAESYRELGNYSAASIGYKNALRSGYQDSTISLRYADALRGAGKPDEAKLIYEARLKKDPKNKRTANGLESIRRFQQWQEIPELYMIENLKNVNSTANDQIVQILPYLPPTICIRSSREIPSEKAINPVTGQKYSGFFTSTLDSNKQKWSIPILLKEPNSLNSPSEELALNFDPNSKLIVFERTLIQPQKPAICKLFFILKKDGQWTLPSPIPFTNDNADYSNPMITEDGKTLWFASNRSGGNGGFDLWKSVITSSTEFTDPENAGNEINTSGNEICPFQKSNEFIYFSSDFHPGIGGYDIFQAQRNNGIWQIEQLPPPINSCGDDLSIQFYGNSEKGFFTSNRKGSRGLDIYSFYLPPKLFQCFGKIHDSETDSILPEVNVRIVGSDGSSQTIRSVNGRFQADLKPENDYAIVVFANGYLNAQAKLSTRGLHEPKEFEVDIKSIPTNKPIRIDNINYESGKWDLLPEAKSSLDKLVDLLKLNPEAVIEISAHTDDLGEKKFNQELSVKRAASVTSYLREKGISDKNLNSSGFGDSMPLIVTRKLAMKYDFIHEGEALNPSTIENLADDNLKEIARGLNRRTEFKVLQAGKLPDLK
jgi:peptidoglycan-associated lipoprotein